MGSWAPRCLLGLFHSALRGICKQWVCLCGSKTLFIKTGGGRPRDAPLAAPCSGSSTPGYWDSLLGRWTVLTLCRHI